MLKDLYPTRVFEIFEEICAIPHGSGNMKAIADYCVGFAEKCGLSFHRDALHNVIIKKPATEGYEGHPTVILQGHLDMVCEKENGSDIDFEKDPILIFTDGEWVWADRTTLGGDDGIAVAMALAVLESDSLLHPPIEALFTVDEETGMYGAEGLDPSLLEGRILINVDSEEEGVLTVGCAGGARAEVTLSLTREPLDKPCFTVTVDGLRGGHSGAEINKGRLNADKVLCKLLDSLSGLRIVDLHGGLKDNAIPAFAECTVYCDDSLEKAVARYIEEIATENDPDLQITVSEAGTYKTAFSNESSAKAVALITALPNGIVRMSDEIEGLPETSLNLGILRIENDILSASFAVRSQKNSEKEALLSKISDIAADFGAGYSTHGHYPAWEFVSESRLRDTMCDVFEEMFGRRPVVDIIHAGLECGLLSEKLPGLDAVSIGPDMCDIHTPRERLSVASTGRIFEYLCEILRKL